MSAVLVYLVSSLYKGGVIVSTVSNLIRRVNEVVTFMDKTHQDTVDSSIYFVIMRKIKVFVYSLDILYITFILSVWVAYPNLRFWVVPNGAMLPSICEGDLLLVGENKNISIGDIVIYSVNEDEICREVVQEIEGGWVTKSTTTGLNDTFTLTKDNYRGTVRLVWHNGVWWNNLIRSTPVLFILVGLTAFLILVW